MEWFRGLLNHTPSGRSIEAVSTHAVDADFWDDPAGIEYLQAQHQRIARDNVTIQRLFVLPESVKSESGALLADSLIARAMLRQRQCGIHVRYLFQSQAIGLDDVVVFDGSVALETILSADGHIRGTVLYSAPEYASNASSVFQSHWKNATPFSDKKQGKWKIVPS